jgi:hypothetical protein
MKVKFVKYESKVLSSQKWKKEIQRG